MGWRSAAAARPISADAMKRPSRKPKRTGSAPVAGEFVALDIRPTRRSGQLGSCSVSTCWAVSARVDRRTANRRTAKSERWQGLDKAIVGHMDLVAHTGWVALHVIVEPFAKNFFRRQSIRWQTTGSWPVDWFQEPVRSELVEPVQHHRIPDKLQKQLVVPLHKLQQDWETVQRPVQSVERGTDWIRPNVRKLLLQHRPTVCDKCSPVDSIASGSVETRNSPIKSSQVNRIKKLNSLRCNRHWAQILHFALCLQSGRPRLERMRHLAASPAMGAPR